MDNWYLWAMTKEAGKLVHPWPDGVAEHLPYFARHIGYWETWQANLFNNEE